MDTNLGAISDPDLTVLVIDSDPESCAVISAYLARRHIQTYCVPSGIEGLAAAQNLAPDVILIDPELSNANGYAIVRLLAQRGAHGVMILSELTDPADRIAGLEIGADDYICKPVAPRELLARIRAVHRRVPRDASVSIMATKPSLAQFGAITMDLTARTVRTACGEDIRLTGAEFSALHSMVAAGGQAVSRDRLSEVALRRTRHSDDRSVDKLIGKLRQKLNAGNGQTQIQCGHGGYRLMTSEPDAWRVPLGRRSAGADEQGLYQPAVA